MKGNPLSEGTASPTKTSRQGVTIPPPPLLSRVGNSATSFQPPTPATTSQSRCKTPLTSQPHQSPDSHIDEKILHRNITNPSCLNLAIDRVKGKEVLRSATKKADLHISKFGNTLEAEMRRNESHHLTVGLSAKLVWYIPSCLQQKKLSLKFPHRKFGAF
ncbi:regulator of telomere elongation helicase 1 homolog [Echinococcus multilocularis]|uniref:Regulator of telomere elongation helicase 1 homolog n=1 Tax=Echinococcus multilocularis TaxID=6211 RepID=A0A0S4MKA2_ECHMU|nr:regulator of telomere elongation helicase 1 homolog [Echinococcus multilocularis]